MQAAVKTPRTRLRIEGDIEPWLIKELKKRYPGMVEIDEGTADEGSVRIEDSKWFQSVSAQLTPGKAMRHYRENRGLSQTALGKRLGPNVAKQHVSNMEKGLRTITVRTAKKLATIFKTEFARFL